MAVSKKANSDIKNAKPIAEVDKIQAPVVPIKRPNKMQDIKLRNGSIKIHKYIN